MSLETVFKKYPPEEFRCAACKARVNAVSAQWRMGFNGWEHKCPDLHPQAGHFPSERICDAGLAESDAGLWRLWNAEVKRRQLLAADDCKCKKESEDDEPEFGQDGKRIYPRDRDEEDRRNNPRVPPS